jgi:hypothetical protein
MQSHNGVPGIVLATEQTFQLQAAEYDLDLIEYFAGFLCGVRLFLG